MVSLHICVCFNVLGAEGPGVPLCTVVPRDVPILFNNKKMSLLTVQDLGTLRIDRAGVLVTSFHSSRSPVHALDIPLSASPIHSDSETFFLRQHRRGSHKDMVLYWNSWTTYTYRPTYVSLSPSSGDKRRGSWLGAICARIPHDLTTLSSPPQSINASIKLKKANQIMSPEKPACDKLYACNSGGSILSFSTDN